VLEQRSLVWLWRRENTFSRYAHALGYPPLFAFLCRRLLPLVRFGFGFFRSLTFIWALAEPWECEFSLFWCPSLWRWWLTCVGTCGVEVKVNGKRKANRVVRNASVLLCRDREGGVRGASISSIFFFGFCCIGEEAISRCLWLRLVFGFSSWRRTCKNGTSIWLVFSLEVKLPLGHWSYNVEDCDVFLLLRIVVCGLANWLLSVGLVADLKLFVIFESMMLTVSFDGIPRLVFSSGLQNGWVRSMGWSLLSAGKIFFSPLSKS